MSFSLKESKAACGAYFNLARHNVALVLQDMEKSLGIQSNADENALSTKKVVTFERRTEVDLLPEQIDLLKRKYLHALPFIKTMASKDLGDINHTAVREVMKNLLLVLNHERNRFSHYAYVSPAGSDKNYPSAEKKVATYLTRCLEEAVKATPEIFKINPDKLSFIGRMEEHTPAKGRRSGHDAPRFVIARDFVIRNAEGGLSDMGRVFLLCLLVQKRYVPRMLSEIKNFYTCCGNGNKETIEAKGKLLRHVLTLYHIRLPRRRLDCEENSIMLALDMLNELKKCPDELYDTLAEINRKKFNVVDAMGENCEMLLKRYSDRFPGFALRYIDSMNIMNQIRFQLSLGRYCYCIKEDKHCVDGNTRLRSVQKELTAFARFDEAESYRRTTLAGMTADGTPTGRRLFADKNEPVAHEPEDFPYITNARTHYLLEGNKVCLWWKRAGERAYKGNFFPELDVQNNTVSAVMPQCYLSLYELPALIFHHFLYTNSQNMLPVHTCIMNAVDKSKKLFSDIISAVEDKENDKEKLNSLKVKCADRCHPQPEEYAEIEQKYGLKWKDIPEKVRDFLTGRTRTSFKKMATARVEEMIAETQRRCEHMDGQLKKLQDKKPDVRNSVKILTGRLSNYIMSDIALFQPTNDGGKDKPTGLNYQAMQKNVAQYNSLTGPQTYEELVEMFRRAGIIDSDHAHPFLKKALGRKPKNTVELYLYEQEAKLAYLKDIQAKGAYKAAYFLHPDSERWKVRSNGYYSALCERYLKQPVILPRGLFETAIRDEMARLIGQRIQELSEEVRADEAQPEDSRASDLLIKQLKDLKNKLPKSNVAYMIAAYFRYLKGDEAQSFYRYKRNYPLFQMLYGSERVRYMSREELELKGKTEGRLKQEASQPNADGKNGLPAAGERETTFREDIEKYMQQFRLDEESFLQKRCRRMRNESNGAWKKRKEHEENDFEEKIDKKKRALIGELKEYEQNELALRRLKIQDYLLFEMAKRMLFDFMQGKADTTQLENCKLSDISPDGERGILEMELPFKMSVGADGKSIKQDNVKIKNYGEFLSLLYDGRIPSLLKVAEGDCLEKDDIVKELETYDELRTKVFSCSLNLERDILNKNPELKTREKMGFRNLVETSMEIGSGENHACESSVSVRNAYAHNSYPNEKYVGGKQLPQIAKTTVASFEKQIGEVRKKMNEKKSGNV